MSTEEVRKAEKELAAQEEASCHAFDAMLNRPKHTAWGDLCEGFKAKWESFKSWF